jgi:hypothetical protein
MTDEHKAQHDAMQDRFFKWAHDAVLALAATADNGDSKAWVNGFVDVISEAYKRGIRDGATIAKNALTEMMARR